MKHPAPLLLLTVISILVAATWAGTLIRGWIVGGREAVPHSRPYMASIQLRGEHHCGGALIRRKWVMTAAHCFENTPFDLVRVVLGAHSLTAQETSRQTFSVQASISHPEYSTETYENDLLLLKLNRAASMNPSVRNISLPRLNVEVAPGTVCMVAGWGDITDFGTGPVALMEASVSVLNRKACNASWRGSLSENGLCATSPEGATRGFCSGDSGGPLICGGRAVGVVSYSGMRCGDPRFPDVYTQVSKFMAWILDVTKRV